jgi:hypothetical protein
MPFSLYPNGIGSVELLSGAPFSWSSLTDGCSDCARRDGCGGPEAGCEKQEEE